MLSSKRKLAQCLLENKSASTPLHLEQRVVRATSENQRDLSFEDLPVEILCYIVSFLSVFEKYKLKSVSWRVNAAASDALKYTSRAVIANHRQPLPPSYPSRALAVILRDCPNLVHLDITEWNINLDGIETELKGIPPLLHLKQFTLGRNRFTVRWHNIQDCQLVSIIDMFPMLQMLCVRYGDSELDGTFLLSASLQNLTDIELWPAFNSSTICAFVCKYGQQLSRLAISRWLFTAQTATGWTVYERCTRLQKLYDTHFGKDVCVTAWRARFADLIYRWGPIAQNVVPNLAFPVLQTDKDLDMFDKPRLYD